MQKLQQEDEQVRKAEKEGQVVRDTIPAAVLTVRTIIDHIPSLAWSCHTDGTAEFLNQRWLDYTGLSPEEALGWGWNVAIHPDDLGKLMDAWLGLLASGKPGEVEARLRRADGEYRWFLSRAVPVQGEVGNVIRWYGINTDIEDRKRAERLLAVENQLLEMIAKSISLSSILDHLCQFVEEISVGSLCSILLLDSDGERLRHGAAPSLPISYTGAIDGISIGPCAGSCGTAAYRNEPIIVSDITTDPLWGAYRDLAAAHGLQACWSTPIRSSDGRVLGTFAIYSRTPRDPNSEEQKMIEQFSHLASIAIERTRGEEKIRQD